MKKLILLITLVLLVPLVALAAPPLQVLLPIQTLNGSQIKDSFSEMTGRYGEFNYSAKTVYSQGVSLHYVGESGLGIGLTQLNHRLSFSYAVDNSSNTWNKTTPVIDMRSYTALEVSMTMGSSFSLTVGAGIPLSGHMQRDYSYCVNTACTTSDYRSLSYGTPEGITSFVTLGLRLFQRGSLLLGIRWSNIKYKPAYGSYSSEQATLSDAMLGYALPFGG